MISGVSNKVATDEVVGSLRESHNSGELLIKVVWDRLEGDDALSKDDSTLLDRKDSVHVSCNVELIQTFNVGVLTVLNICLRFLELLSKFDTRVGENYPLEID